MPAAATPAAAAEPDVPAPPPAPEPAPAEEQPSITGRTLVIIPALNEADSIGHVVSATKAAFDCDVLVVDDGSQDRTAALARSAGAHVISHPFNLGVGAAIRTGLRVAAAGGYDLAVQVDGDGQHDPLAARRLLERVAEGHADLVVGSRFAGTDAGYAVGRVRRMAMRRLSASVSKRTGVTLTDTTSGFRAFSRPAIERFARSYPTAYLSDTVEALLLAADAGLTIEEQPASMRERMGGRPSSGGLMSVMHLARLALVIALHKVREPLRSRAAAT